MIRVIVLTRPQTNGNQVDILNAPALNTAPRLYYMLVESEQLSRWHDLHISHNRSSQQCFDTADQEGDQRYDPRPPPSDSLPVA